MKTSRSIVLLALFVAFGVLGCGSTGSSVSASAGSADLTEANVRRTLDAFVSRNGGSFEYIGVRELQSGTEAVADLSVRDMVVGPRVFSGRAVAHFVKYKGDLGDRWVMSGFMSAEDPFTDTGWNRLNFNLMTRNATFRPLGLNPKTVQSVLNEWVGAGGQSSSEGRRFLATIGKAEKAEFVRIESEQGNEAIAVFNTKYRLEFSTRYYEGPVRAEFGKHPNGVWVMRRVVSMQGAPLWEAIEMPVVSQLGS